MLGIPAPRSLIRIEYKNEPLPEFEGSGSFFNGKRNPPAMLVEVKALAMQKKPPMLQWKRPGSRPK